MRMGAVCTAGARCYNENDVIMRTGLRVPRALQMQDVIMRMTSQWQ